MAAHRVLILVGISLALAWYGFFGRHRLGLEPVGNSITIRRPLVQHQPKVPKTLIGLARVLDGDTIEIRGITLRLAGVDAPEVQQTCRTDAGNTWPCGATAKDKLRSKIGMGTVSCEARGRDRYGRVMATCATAGEELNAWLVREGWALSYVPFGDRFRREEDDARKYRRGIWTGILVAPWIWRDQHERGPIYKDRERAPGVKRIRVAP